MKKLYILYTDGVLDMSSVHKGHQLVKLAGDQEIK